MAGDMDLGQGGPVGLGGLGGLDGTADRAGHVSARESACVHTLLFC